jgi:hypothetical protein
VEHEVVLEAEHPESETAQSAFVVSAESAQIVQRNNGER